MLRFYRRSLYLVWNNKVPPRGIYSTPHILSIHNYHHLHPPHTHHHLAAFVFRFYSTQPAVSGGDHHVDEENGASGQKIEEIRRFRSAIKMLRKDLEKEVELEKKEHERNEQLQLESKDKGSLPVRVWKLVCNPRELGRIIWRGILHTYHGFRLFGLEFGLTIKYLAKLKRGQPLLRKERQQMIRTFADIARLGPFMIFIVVPFMEILLPFYIKIFPKMMPSTFHDTTKEEEKHRKQLKDKIETAKLLQDTLEEIALARKEQGLNQGKQAYEFAQFLKKIRTGEGGYINNEELFKFIKLFEDELTLDNLSMVQLRALCRLLGIAKLGTPEILRFRLHMKLRELKADDKLIDREGGVDVLSAQELQAACRARGMRAIGLSEERLRQQLRQWVELSLDDQVPPSLLLLSRAMYFPEDLDFTERIRSIVATLPKEIGDHKAITLKQLEGKPDPRAKIELLKGIEAALKAERKMREGLEELKRERREKEAAEAQKMLEESEKELKKMSELADGRDETARKEEEERRLENELLEVEDGKMKSKDEQKNEDDGRKNGKKEGEEEMTEGKQQDKKEGRPSAEREDEEGIPNEQKLMSLEAEKEKMSERRPHP